MMVRVTRYDKGGKQPEVRRVAKWCRAVGVTFSTKMTKSKSLGWIVYLLATLVQNTFDVFFVRQFKIVWITCGPTYMKTHGAWEACQSGACLNGKSRW